MRISMPVRSRAKKHSAVIQCVMRTRAECREVFVAVETAGGELGTMVLAGVGMDPEVAIVSLPFAAIRFLRWGVIVHRGGNRDGHFLGGKAMR